MIDIETRSTWWERTLAFPQLWESSTRARFQDWLFCSIRILNIEPPESFVPLILILSSRPSMSSLRSLTSPPQASRSAFDYNLPIGICTIHENLCLRSATWRSSKSQAIRWPFNIQKSNKEKKEMLIASPEERTLLHSSPSWRTRNRKIRRELLIYRCWLLPQ